MRCIKLEAAVLLSLCIVLKPRMVISEIIKLHNICRNSVIQGCLSSFRCKLEMTAMIAGNIAGKTRTLPMAVYSEVAAGDMDAAYRYVAIIVVIAFLSVILMNRAALREKKRRLS